MDRAIIPQKTIRTIAVILLLFLGTSVARAGQVPARSQPTLTGEELPFEKLVFVCNSSNGTINATSISPTGKAETSAEPFSGPLILTLKFFLSKQSRWELDFKDSSDRSLFDWHGQFRAEFGEVSSTHAERSLSIERKEKEIEKVNFSTISGPMPGRAFLSDPQPLSRRRSHACR
jgi:hypothetical protein